MKYSLSEVGSEAHMDQICNSCDRQSDVVANTAVQLSRHTPCVAGKEPSERIIYAVELLKLL